ncbi:MAG: hypothetical protein WDW38_007882 [Sanguina aurantia]
MHCFNCFTSKKQNYLPREDIATPTTVVMDFKHVPEPLLSELVAYVLQRKEHITYYATAADIRTEVTKNVTEQRQPIDQYPKGRQFLHDDDYCLVLKDLLNLSNILDDMELTGSVPYQSRTLYYNMYCKLYRVLLNKAKNSS